MEALKFWKTKLLKRIIPLLTAGLVCFSFFSCAKQALAEMTTLQQGAYTAIVWDGKIYVPYCAIEKSKCGEQIGIVDHDKNDRVYEYEGYAVDEWIINVYVSGLMDSAMLLREVNVTDIPDGLQSEYEWNS